MAQESGRLVLVVDDDEGVRDLLTLLVKKEGWRVETAEDGIEGERKALALKPDLIVLDLMLPRYGGFRAVEAPSENYGAVQSADRRRDEAAIRTTRPQSVVRQESNVVELIRKAGEGACALSSRCSGFCSPKAPAGEGGRRPDMDERELPRGAPGEKLVLLVDDDESLLDLMEHVVKAEGFRTDRCEDRPEALRKAQALESGYHHPRHDAARALAATRSMRQLQGAGCGDIPIIIVTRRTMDPAGIELIRQESNVKEFMAKPVRPATIAATLHRLLNTQPIRSPRREPGT